MQKQLFSEQEMDDFYWLFEHYSEWMRKYPNKWIAVYKKELVAIGDDAEEVGKKARDKFGKTCTPVVAFIEGGAYVYQISTPYSKT